MNLMKIINLGVRMDNIQEYEKQLNRAFDYLLCTAENNGFYSPTRQAVCVAIYEKKDRSVENLEIAIKYLFRRFQEQDLHVFLNQKICKSVSENPLWQQRWPNKEIAILASGEEYILPK